VSSLAILSAATIAPASAADIPVKAPTVQAVVFSWTGMYAGVHGGYGWGNNGTRDTHFFNQINGAITPLGVPDLEEIPAGLGINSRGFLGGGHFGFNYQMNRLVVGGEVDLSYTGIKGSAGVSGTVTSGGPPVTQPFSMTHSQHYQLLASVRARAGVTVLDNLLLYGTGGFAWTSVEQSLRLAFGGVGGTTYSGTGTQSPYGWVAGGGGEYALTRNLIARVEYLHYEFSSTRFSAGGDNVFQLRATFNNRLDVVRGALSWKLN
jgi:outer membrane immunogenic protein